MIRLFRAREAAPSPSEERSNCDYRDDSEDVALLAEGNSFVQQLLRSGILLVRGVCAMEGGGEE